MPVMPLKRPFDRYASLAWTSSLTVLALEKLRRKKSLRDEEQEALRDLTSEFDLLSESTKITIDQISGEETKSFTPEELEGFFTLAEIEEASAKPITEVQLKQAAADLLAIQQMASTQSHLDSAVVDRAQAVCLQFLSSIDKLRPEVSTP
jgi:hypothetical protein